jgi:hypothetical protein
MMNEAGECFRSLYKHTNTLKEECKPIKYVKRHQGVMV